MRNISFFLTKDQILARSKTVTRRAGWGFAIPGMLLQPIEKGQGLWPGGRVQRLGGPIRLVSVRSERLDRLIEDPTYGRAEAILEGFPDWDGPAFVRFLAQQRGCYLEMTVNRLEFEYVDPKTVIPEE